MGSYTDSSGTHGFLLSKGKFTTITIAGSSGTVTRGINPEGSIVGSFSDAGKSHGFLLSKGKVSVIDPPNGLSTPLSWLSPSAINPAGDIVGTGGLGGSSGIYRGFLLRDGVLTILNSPDLRVRPVLIASGISPSGAIVGSYDASDGVKAYVWEDGVFHLLNMPSASGSAGASGISPQGYVVGTYRDSSYVLHSYLARNGSLEIIDVPVAGAHTTAALGINARGDIVGSYSDLSGDHGFLLSH